MSKRKTTEEFISEAKLVHGNKYDYSKVVYTNAKSKVTIICPIHGKFEQTSGKHLANQGCPKCSLFGIRYTSENYLKLCADKHSNKYDYSKTLFKSVDIKIEIVCPEHGSFWQVPSHHLNRGHGCPLCKSEKAKVGIDEFIERSNKIHNNKYAYSKAIYNSTKTPLIITCPIHGDFEQSPNVHLQGHGCPGCAVSGFDKTKSAYLYYLKITTDTNQVLYKIGITNRTVNERFNLTDLNKIEIVKQKLYDNGQDALDWETRLKRMYKEYQYKGPDILSSGNTELFTEDIIAILECK